ncbi:hypothetical protein COCNU_contig68910186G000010 [Cocos nucifera]|nr:hypothetical protein [Cocos nucifera]
MKKKKNAEKLEITLQVVLDRNPCGVIKPTKIVGTGHGGLLLMDIDFRNQ